LPHIAGDSPENPVRGGFARLRAPVTFGGAGTSLSGQAAADSALLLLGDGWRKGRARASSNEQALRPLKESLPADCGTGYSSCRPCGTGRFEQAGFPYRSILYLVERCASAPIDQASAVVIEGGTAAAGTDIASATSSAMSRDSVAPADASAPKPSAIITAQ
jgi:hypothetical protein